MNRLFSDPKWRAAATRLTEQGYIKVETPGLAPAVFTHPTEADVYLVLVPGQGARMAEREWKARPVADKPEVFGLVEAAEHLGVSVSTLKHAMSSGAKNPLAPDRRLNYRNLLFREETLVAWNERREGRGAKPTAKYMSYDRLYLINKPTLIDTALRHLAGGRLPAGPFADALMMETGRNRWDLIEIASQRPETFAEMLDLLPRSTLIDLMADHYQDQPPADMPATPATIEMLVYDESAA